MMRSLATVRVLRLATVMLALVVLGEAAHLVFDELHAMLAHHLFHILFPLAAFAVFAAFVALDIRARGWPTFSWRLPKST